MLFILIGSILFQLITIYYLIKLIRITIIRLPWVFIASASLLMMIRSCLTLFLIISDPLTHHHDITTEIIVFLTSLFMAVGIMKITPLINAIVHSSKMAQREKDELKTYIDLAGIIFVVIDPNQKVMMINKKGCDILGYDDKNSIIGRNWFDNFIPERLRNNVKDTFNKLISGKVEAIEYYENPILTSSGKEKIICWHNTLLENDNGNFIGTLSAGEDITERIRIEELAKKSEEKFKILADESPNMIFINCKGKILYMNKKSEEILGYTKEEFYSPDFDFLKLIAPESLSRVKEHYSKHLSGKEIAPYDYTLLTKDGIRIEAIITTKLIDYGDDKAILGIITDITKRKQLETELLESEKRYRHLIELCPDAIAVHSEGKVVYINNVGLKLLGAKSIEDIIGKPILEFVHPDYWKTVKDRIQNMLINGDNAPLIEEKFIRLDGSIIDLEITASPITYHGKTAVQVVLRDISERKKIVEELKESQLKFKTLFDHIPDAIYLESMDGKIIDCNVSSEKITGYTRKELLRMSAKDLVPKEVANSLPGLANELINKGFIFIENFNVNKNGAFFPVEVFMKIIEINKEKYVFVITRDISERRKAEQEIRQSEEKYKSLVNSIPEMIFETDKQGNIKFANSSGLNIFGYTSDDIENGLNIFSLLDKPDKEIAKMNFNNLIDGKITELTYEYSAVKKNGVIIPIIVYSHAIYNNSNEISGIGGIAIDTTEQKKLEDLKKDFVAFFSHEARNPLSTIKEGISMIDDEIAGSITDEQKDIISLAKNNVDRLFSLINNFLDFSKLEHNKPNLNLTSFDIQKQLKMSLDNFKNKIKEQKLNITIKNKDPFIVYADSHRIEDVFSNLISNAIKFSNINGNIVIDISEDGEFIKVSIEDNGIGIKKEDIPNIFSKYSKATISDNINYDGIGLGLTITKQLIELMDGKIWVESEHGKGSKFTFTVPKAKQ